MSKRFFYKHFVVLVSLLFAVGITTSCKDYQDDIDSLRTEVTQLKGAIPNAESIKKDLQNELATVQKGLNDKVVALQAKVTELESQLKNADAVTKKQLEDAIADAKKELETAFVTAEAYNNFAAKAEAKFAELDNLTAGKIGEELDKTLKQTYLTVAKFNEFTGKSNLTLDKIEAQLKNYITVEDLEKSELAKRVALLETLLELKDGKSALVDTIKGLENFDATELTKKIEANEAAIKALNEILGVKENPAEGEYANKIAEFDALMEKLGLSFKSLVKLNNLIVIPDYVAEGGALPVVDFSNIVTSCGDISLNSEVKFRLSPSTVTIDDINVDKIKVHYNNPTIKNLRGADIKPEVVPGSVKVEAGVLSLKVKIDTKELEPATSDKIDQIQLEVVTNTDPASSVFSDWIALTATPIQSTDLHIAVAVKNITQFAVDQHIATTLSEAKAQLPGTDIRVIDIEYTETLDLNEKLMTLFNLKKFDMEKYGLSFAYDLNDEKGKAIVYELGNNKTDQQQFIRLSGSEVSTRVYTIDGPNPASVYRTPIVHVMLKSDVTECPVAEGFIKLNIVPKKAVEIDPILVEVKGGDVEASCDAYSDTIHTVQMNEDFYAKAELSKEEFHNLYQFSVDTEGVGTITEVPDPSDTHSYNLVWEVSKDDMAKNVGKTISKKAYYTYGPNKFTVKFSINVKQPELNLGELKIDNYWYGNHVKHNVAVPALGSKDASLATFANNISQAFKTTDAKLLDLKAGYSYEYKFVKSISADPGYKLTVSPDGLSLLVTKEGVTETVATITNGTADGDILAYNESSDLAKELLNLGREFMKVQLQITAKNECGKDLKVTGLPIEGDKFNVHFLRPINANPVSEDHFVDGQTFGDEGTLLDLKKIVGLEDWRNFVKGTTDYSFEPKNLNYYDYYGVTTITVDKTNIKTEGLTIDGKPATSLPSTVEVGVLNSVAELTAMGVVDTSKYPAGSNYGVLYYKNNGNTLNTEFTLVVPITIEYKWGTIVNEVVRVPVKPTSSLRSAH